MVDKDKMVTIFKETWEAFLHDDSYNDLGKLNLAAWMGERVGSLLTIIDEQEDKNKQLQMACESMEWSYYEGTMQEGLCPECKLPKRIGHHPKCSIHAALIT